MVNRFLVSFFISFFAISFSQKPEKITFKDTENYYYKILPEGKPQGMIIILPGGGETPERVMNQIYLDELAFDKNLIVLFPAFEDGNFKMTIEKDFLSRIAKEVVVLITKGGDCDFVQFYGKLKPQEITEIISRISNLKI